MVEFTHLSVPEPWGLGGVNAYLVHAAEPAIIDPGPHMKEARQAIRKGVADAGYALTDIEHILVTHPHSDHFGNAAWLRGETGAMVHAHTDMADVVESFEEHKRRQQSFFPPYLAKMGVPWDAAEQVISAYLPNRVDASLPVDDRLAHGDAVDLGDSVIEVFHAPGHARGNSCFLLEEESMAFTGDHVLADITPNPTLQVPEDGGIPPNSLGRYMESLRAFPESYERGWGGHGDPITDLPGRVEEIIDHHIKRLDRTRAYLDDSVTPYELMQRFFPDLPEGEVFLGMSEVIGHLRVLEGRGDVEREMDGETYVFHAR